MQAEAQILSEIAALRAEIRMLIDGKPKETIGIKDVMQLTGCNSYRAQYRWNRKHGIRAYDRNKYRRLDLTNKITALAIKANQSKPQLT